MCQPGMARRAEAGPMDAGSEVVATNRITILFSLSFDNGFFAADEFFADHRTGHLVSV